MDVKKYLRYVLELEKELYTIEKVINNLSIQSDKLGIRKEYKEPAYVNVDKKPEKIELFFCGVAFGVIGAIVTFVVGTIANSCFAGDFTFGTLGKAFLFFLVIGSIIGYFLEKDLIKYEIEKYAENIEKYEAALSFDKARVAEELKKKRTLDTQIASLRNRKNEIANTLKRLYGINILYPKYRYFVAVATMYEYFESGRCRALEGHEGAYNIYENELRLNLIVNQLSDIIYRLEDIKSNQMIVYNAIKEGNRLSNEICNNSARLIQQNQEITENTALVAYNSRVAAKNTEIMKFIALYT